jgi:hypothetical protein
VLLKLQENLLQVIFFDTKACSVIQGLSNFNAAIGQGPFDHRANRHFFDNCQD